MRVRHIVTPLGLVFLTGTLLASALPAWADMFQCADGHGGLVLKNAPCAGTWTLPPVAPASLPTETPDRGPGQASALAQPRTTRNPSLDAALSALRRLQAATSVGVSRLDYARLVADAQALLDGMVIADRSLAYEVEHAMEGYRDALTWWGLRDGTLKPGMDLRTYTRILRTYQLERADHLKRSDDPLSIIWQEAARHLDRAAQAAAGEGAR